MTAVTESLVGKPYVEMFEYYKGRQHSRNCTENPQTVSAVAEGFCPQCHTQLEPCSQREWDGRSDWLRCQSSKAGFVLFSHHYGFPHPERPSIPGCGWHFRLSIERPLAAALDAPEAQT